MKRYTLDLQVTYRRFFPSRVTGTVVVYEGPAMPGILRLAVYSEESDMLKFKLTPIPAPGAPDVVRRELTVTVADGAPTLIELAPDQTEATSDTFVGNDNDRVLTSLVDIDDAGNRSPAREQEFTLTDTIAPPEPGAIGLEVTEEV